MRGREASIRSVIAVEEELPMSERARELAARFDHVAAEFVSEIEEIPDAVFGVPNVPLKRSHSPRWLITLPGGTRSRSRRSPPSLKACPPKCSP